MTIKNIHVLTHHVEVAIYIQCSDNTPLKAFYPTGIDIEGGQEMHWIFSVPIPSNAPSGEAIIFANLYSDQPKTGGTAYCPEKNATFCIQSTTPKAPPQPQYFNITFKLPRKDVKLGNYNIYARSRYITSLASENIFFNVILAGDIVKDYIINMRDIGAVCALYGTTEEDPDWNPDADLVKDGIINMRDIGAECNNYGKTAIY